MWFAFGMAALLLVLGLLVHAFKLHFLISGYNTMSRAKREKVDVRRVARAIGVWSYANTAVFTVVGLLLALEIAVPIEVPLVFFGITTLVLLVRAQRYDGNIFDEDGNLRPGAGRQLALAGGVIGALVIGIIALLFLSSRPVEITATEEGVEISGLYGTTLEWESITEARLLGELPTIEMRTNGSAVGSQLRGHFRTAEYGPVRLFVDAEIPPFLLLDGSEGVVILNLGSAADTEELFARAEAEMAAP